MKNTKKQSFKKVEHKKNEKSRKLRLMFPFSATIVCEIHCFIAVLCVLVCF